jgi:hypothetical protein
MAPVQSKFTEADPGPDAGPDAATTMREKKAVKKRDYRWRKEEAENALLRTHPDPSAVKSKGKKRKAFLEEIRVMNFGRIVVTEESEEPPISQPPNSQLPEPFHESYNQTITENDVGEYPRRNYR